MSHRRTGIVVGLLGVAMAWALPATTAAAHTAADSMEPARGASVVMRIAYYGDSLAFEAEDHFVAAVTASGRAEVRTGTYGGTAICDWLERMRRDAMEWSPYAVVVEFSGNALTPCMHDAAGAPLSGGPYLRRYRRDAAEVVRVFSAVGARVYFAGSPISRTAERSGDFNGGRINDIYRSLPGAHYVAAGAAVLDSGHYTDTLPCLPVEPCTGPAGSNVVRAGDGAHFCPGGDAARDGVTGACTVWSSGAFRYGHAMAAPVIRDLGL